MGLTTVQRYTALPVIQLLVSVPLLVYLAPFLRYSEILVENRRF